MAITYAELLERQEVNRTGFGRMLLNWRRRNGWTQYTACSWAEEAGFETISYGNLSVIEQGKAGELRQKAFWQLAELNRRIAEQDWGTVKSPAIKQKLEGAIPLGDDACPIWTAACRGAAWRSAACTRWRAAAMARWTERLPPALRPGLPRVCRDKCSGA